LLGGEMSKPYIQLSVKILKRRNGETGKVGDVLDTITNFILSMQI
ncbi:3307_t:CDS:1, partial [Dentiscutata heterogama]